MGNQFTIKKIEIKRTNRADRKGERNPWSPKLYLFIGNESIIENVINRRTRPYTEYKKQVLPKVMDSIRETDPDLYDKLKNVQWAWDRYNGCSVCPCSPGFYAKNRKNEFVDIFVTI